VTVRKRQKTAIEQKHEVLMAVKQEKCGRPAVGFGEADDYPDVVEVAGPPGTGLNQEVFVFDVDANDGDSGSGGVDMDVVAVVGSDNMLVASDMPHPRETCTKFPFSKYPTAWNERCCPNCFCFVCEIKACECQVDDPSFHVCFVCLISRLHLQASPPPFFIDPRSNLKHPLQSSPRRNGLPTTAWHIPSRSGRICERRRRRLSIRICLLPCAQGSGISHCVLCLVCSV
jgi:hypothetical protein